MEQQQRVTILWNMYKEECDWMRHNETQRGSLTTLLIAVYGALLAFLPKDRLLYASDWPSPVLLVLLGLVGVVAVIKYWERFQFHARVSRAFRAELDQVGADVSSVWETGSKAHFDDRSTWLKDPFMQHYIWVGVHAAAALLGAVLLVTAMCGGHRPG